MNTRPCIRCLIADIGDDQIVEIIRQYHDSLPEEYILDEISYRKRLSVCLDCKFLNRGTCLKNGSYVEAFAKDSRKSCPYGKNLWG